MTPRCRVTVCRGCCCGTVRKHPDVDADGQLRRLEEFAAVRVVDCLDVCGESNVVVVQPSPAGRRAGGRPAWLGWINDDGAIDLVAEWLDAGGPGLADVPAALDLHSISPPRR